MSYPAFAKKLIPVLIFSTLLSGRGLSEETPEARIVAQELRVAQATPAQEEAVLKFFIKTARLVLAIAFSDPQLVLQEVETYDQILDEVETLADSAGQPGAFNEFRTILELVKLDTLAEVGLATDFAEKSRQLIPQADTNNKLSILGSGIKMALRQGRTEESRGYLQQAQEVAKNNPDEVNPVFRMFLETAEFQQELAEGASFTDQQVLERYQRAWGTLDSYSPNDNISGNTSWYHGRWATRFWISELARIGLPAEAALKAQMLDFQRWMVGFEIDANQTAEETNNPFLMLDRLHGAYTFAFTGMDILTYVLEQRKDLITKTEQDGLLAKFDALVKELTDRTQELDLDLRQPGFPPFDLSQSAFITELRARSRFLRGIDPGKPPAQRVALLQKVDADLAALRIPTSYVHYQIALGKAYKDAGRSDLATAPWERALAKAEEYSFQNQAVEAASLLATEYGSQEEWSKARLYANRATDRMKEDIGATGAPELTEKSSQLAHLEAKAHLKTDNPQLALAALNEGHQMGNAMVRIRGNKEASEATAELNKRKKRVASLSQKVKELQQMPESEMRDELLNKAEKLLAESRSEFLLQSRQIRQKFSNLYSTTLRFDPLNLPDIQKSLPPEAAVVQYFATEDELYIFLVTREKFRLRAVDIGKKQLDKTVLGYLSTIKRFRNTKLDERSQALYAALLAPIEEDLQSTDLVVLIPSGKLNVLPFASLQDETGNVLLEKKTILELAQPTDFMKIAFTKPKRIEEVVAFANATLDLPSAETEGKNITALFPESQLFTGKEASKENLVQFGSQAQVLHLATHGIIDSSDSLKNHLLLSGNQRLAQEEIFNLDLEETDIVTLSACNTATSDSSDVDYVASLAEAFWIAGSKTVVASLWPVDDESTGRLMTRFYEGLKAGESRAEALKNAQLAVRSNPDYAHPYFWSGFVLFGDYR